MKSSQQALNHISDIIQKYLDQPQNHAPNPVALEEVLVHLFGLYQFIMHDDVPDIVSAYSKYFDFLRSKGYGVSTYSGRFYEPTQLTNHDLNVYSGLCSIWQEYLSYAASTTVKD